MRHTNGRRRSNNLIAELLKPGLCSLDANLDLSGAVAYRARQAELVCESIYIGSKADSLHLASND